MLLRVAAALRVALPALLLAHAAGGIGATRPASPWPDRERPRERRGQPLAVVRAADRTARPLVGRNSCLETLATLGAPEVVERHVSGQPGGAECFLGRRVDEHLRDLSVSEAEDLPVRLRRLRLSVARRRALQ
jgi:hypothetical protein